MRKKKKCDVDADLPDLIPADTRVPVPTPAGLTEHIEVKIDEKSDERRRSSKSPEIILEETGTLKFYNLVARKGEDD